MAFIYIEKKQLRQSQLLIDWLDLLISRTVLTASRPLYYPQQQTFFCFKNSTRLTISIYFYQGLKLQLC